VERVLYIAKQSIQHTKASANIPPVALKTMKLMSQILLGIAWVYFEAYIYPFLLTVDR
jgi:hypothetical protein